MDRRTILKAAMALGAAAHTGSALAAAGATGTARRHRLFRIDTEIDLSAHAGDARLWVPLFASRTAYQRVTGLSWQGNARAEALGNRRQMARVLAASWPADNAERKLVVSQQIATWERDPALPAPRLSSAERAFWTAPLPGMPTGGLVADTARRIVGERGDPLERLRAIYDWVVASTWRDPATVGCGSGDIAAMLEAGRMGGKCADINGLMVGLARAVGIPARDVYGIRLASSRLSPSLGRQGNVSGAQHCRAEAWIDGKGWIALDPADVRKAILEDKLEPDSAAARSLAEHFFGHWEDNWAAFNMGTGLALDGALDRQPYNFVMYPTAACAGTQIACTRPAEFAYRITSTELTG